MGRESSFDAQQLKADVSDAHNERDPRRRPQKPKLSRHAATTDGYRYGKHERTKKSEREGQVFLDHRQCRGS